MRRLLGFFWSGFFRADPVTGSFVATGVVRITARGLLRVFRPGRGGCAMSFSRERLIRLITGLPFDVPGKRLARFGSTTPGEIGLAWSALRRAAR